MRKQRILFVDDEPNVLRSYARSLYGLSESWIMEFEDSPVDALVRIQEEDFDLVVSDVRMPMMSGLELLAKLKGNPRTENIPVVIVTGEADQSLKRQSLDLDAADLLSKPICRDDLVARLRSVLRLKEYADRLRDSNELLEQRVRERTAELEASRIDILWRLGKAAEYRDEETGNHVIRVGSYSRVVAKALGMNDQFCQTLFLAAPLHDIGKIGISDTVLLKPGKLTDEEWTKMRGHCDIGVSILTDPCKLMHIAFENSATSSSCAVSRIPRNPVIDMAAIIAATHHEKWDGTGYPRGLSGTDIPLVGRIVAIADVYDALRSNRPYKEAFSIERSLDILLESRGSHFDPDVVDAFIAAYEEISSIEHQYSDLHMPPDRTQPSNLFVPSTTFLKTEQLKENSHC